MINDFYPGYVSIVGQFSDGLYHVNPKTGHMFKTPVSKDFLDSRNYFHAKGLARLSDDELLMTNNLKVFYYKKGMDEIEYYKWQPENQFSSFTQIMIDPKKRAWIGSSRDGLWTIDTKTGTTKKHFNQDLYSAQSDFVDHIGNILAKIGKGHGVYSAMHDTIYTFLYEADSTRTFFSSHRFCQCPNGENMDVGQS